MRRVSIALGLLALAPFALAQQGQQVRLGVSVNAYFFGDKNVRDALGDPAVTYGANLSALDRPRANKLSFSYNVITASKGDSTLFLLPLTIGYEVQFADRKTASILPYARVEAGGSYYDVALHNGDYDKSFKTFGAVGAAELGVVFSRNLALRGRYNLFQDRGGVSLSGFEVGVTYNFGGF